MTKKSATYMHAPSSAKVIQQLPAAVQRYLSFALGGSKMPAGHVQLEQSGELRRTTHSRWLRFDATQWAAPEAGSFVWNARVRLIGQFF